MKTAVISGVGGQDGSILAHQLLDKGYFVIGLKRRTSTINTYRIDDIYDNSNFKVEYFDLNDATSINKIISKYKPNEYYNLASQSHVRVSFDVPVDTMNGIINGTLFALEAIRNFSPRTKFYQASSSEQYGDGECPEKGFNEESKFQPASPYAIAKCSAHYLTQHYRRAYNIFACCGILFNHESEFRGDTFVSKKISAGVVKIKYGKQNVLTLGNLEAKRDWGYAPEYTNGMWLMLQKDIPDDYVLATGETHSVREYLIKTLELAGLDKEINSYINIDPIYFRDREVHYLLGSAEKAKKLLNWTPQIKFADIIKIMYEYEKNICEGYENTTRAR